ncbi:MAG: Uncharacterised protein [Methanobacteriota archaeon]|nr:MAG: Uncharacterised protein [Euryarchaeota archaeon]
MALRISPKGTPLPHETNGLGCDNVHGRAADYSGGGEQYARPNYHG